MGQMFASSRGSPSEPIYILVMGVTGAGKSRFISLALGHDVGIGHGSKSCTEVVTPSPPFMVGGKLVILVDTPGLDDTHKPHTDIVKIIGKYLFSMKRKGEPLVGVIYLERITDFSTSAIFLEGFRKLLGDVAYPNVVIVTTMWDRINLPMERCLYRERDLKTNRVYYKPVLDGGAVMLRHNNTTESAHGILEHFVDKEPISLRIQKEMGIFKPVTKTAVYDHFKHLSKYKEAMRERHAQGL